jgi:lipoyl-dependent peroxiredoxin subunit D
MMSNIKETTAELLDIFELSEITNPALQIINQTEFKYLRDLKLNFNSTLTSEHISEKECGLLGLSVATNNQIWRKR